MVAKELRSFFFDDYITESFNDRDEHTDNVLIYYTAFIVAGIYIRTKGFKPP